MAGMVVLGMILRWMHILSAIALMGGAIFQRMVLLPAAELLPNEAHEKLKAAVRGRWSRVVMASAGLLLLSGLANFGILIVAYQLDKSTLVGGKYHMLFGIKFLLALVVLYIASMLAGRSSMAERARQNARFWLSLNLVLATAVVCLGGILRQADRTLKPSESSSVASPEPAAAIADLSRAQPSQ